MAERELQFEDLYYKSEIAHRQNESARLKVNSFALFESTGGTRYILENLEGFLVVQGTRRARKRQRGYRAYQFDDGNNYYDVAWSKEPVIAEAVLQSGSEGAITMPLYEASKDDSSVPAGCMTILGLTAVNEIVVYADGQDLAIYTPAPQPQPDIFVPFTVR